ncbi:chromodomain-helicase-DNA-binding protein 4 [Striga asiatica]|uniref:Chromodomain-helicase-DNA-binding protein 4 n=1 Tax=Striga asiatica TaxID=4170 RepID=A0A5A7PIJ7_STRAF|nr:chromodomain-helicase-DNA-binding protein 4 [Striga asiatica]
MVSTLAKEGLQDEETSGAAVDNNTKERRREVEEKRVEKNGELGSFRTMESSIASFHKETEKLNKMQSKGDKILLSRSHTFRSCVAVFTIIQFLLVANGVPKEGLRVDDVLARLGALSVMRNRIKIGSHLGILLTIKESNQNTPGESSSNGATFDVDMKDSSSYNWTLLSEWLVGSLSLSMSKAVILKHMHRNGTNSQRVFKKLPTNDILTRRYQAVTRVVAIRITSSWHWQHQIMLTRIINRAERRKFIKKPIIAK